MFYIKLFLAALLIYQCESGSSSIMLKKHSNTNSQSNLSNCTTKKNLQIGQCQKRCKKITEWVEVGFELRREKEKSMSCTLFDDYPSAIGGKNVARKMVCINLAQDKNVDLLL